MEGVPHHRRVPGIGSRLHRAIESRASAVWRRGRRPWHGARALQLVRRAAGVGRPVHGSWWSAWARRSVRPRGAHRVGRRGHRPRRRAEALQLLRPLRPGGAAARRHGHGCAWALGQAHRSGRPARTLRLVWPSKAAREVRRGHRPRPSEAAKVGGHVLHRPGRRAEALKQLRLQQARGEARRRGRASGAASSGGTRGPPDVEDNRLARCLPGAEGSCQRGTQRPRVGHRNAAHLQDPVPQGPAKVEGARVRHSGHHQLLHREAQFRPLDRERHDDAQVPGRLVVRHRLRELGRRHRTRRERRRALRTNRPHGGGALDESLRHCAVPAVCSLEPQRRRGS
mmetsp:Transcript_104113/g.324612  ORF Transcript_104113/g.324612 Transcript_104113/m.324612 type:complete len:340 (+) Transcript_104113:183-1202(+)